MTVLLFGPRWILLVPLLPLAFAIARFRPPLLVPLLVAGVVGVGPVMGFNIGWRRLGGHEVAGSQVRVVTLNVAGGTTLSTSVPWIIEETRADIIAFQECGNAVVDEVRALPKVAWSTSVQDQMCLVSRFPIIEVRQLERESLRNAGGSGIVIAYTLEIEGWQFKLANLHLDTPRAGLAPVREGQVSEGFAKLRSKSIVREIESRQARRWLDTDMGATVVLGDFNLPPESVIFQRYWGDLRNTFSYVGFGFGFTRFAGWIRARIDHILVDEGWKVKRAFVGPDFGSDHRPMIADLIVPSNP